MTAKKKTSAQKAEPELKLPPWADKIPLILLAVGAVLVLAGFVADQSHFAHAWLVSFMFYLSICLGAFFLVLLHYLFDSYWIVSIRGGALGLFVAVDGGVVCPHRHLVRNGVCGGGTGRRCLQRGTGAKNQRSC